MGAELKMKLNIKLGRTDRNHIEVVEKLHGGLKLAVLDKQNILKSFVRVSPARSGSGYEIGDMDGYCRAGDRIDPRAVVRSVLTDAAFARAMAA